MIGVDVAIVGVTVAVVLAGWRVVMGPTPADRAVAADLVSFSVVALIALVGVRAQSTATLDIVLVATLVAFLSAVSLARILTRGWR